MKKTPSGKSDSATAVERCCSPGQHPADCCVGHDDDYEDAACTHCGGDGLTECTDPLQCMDPKCDGQMCACLACGGSGDGKDQTIW